MKSKSLFFLFLIHTMVLTAQQWEPMDLGFEHQNTNSSGVFEMHIHPQTGLLQVCGFLSYDGRGIDIQGIIEWNKTTRRWNNLYVERPTGCLSFNYYNDLIYADGGLTEITFENLGGLNYLNNNDWIYLSDGPAETGFSSVGIFKIKEIDNKLYSIGGFSFVDNQPTYGIAIYDGENFEGIEIESIGQRLDDIVKWRDDIYIVGKNMYEPPEYDWHGLARLTDGTLESVHEEFSGPYFDLHVYSLAVFQDKLFIGGNFRKEIGFTGNCLQYFDGEEMHEVGGGLNGPVYDMKVYKGELYVSGNFKRIGEGTSYQDYENGQICYNIAKWDGENWHSLNDQFLAGCCVNAIEIYEDTLYIGGNWMSIGGDTTMSCIARRKITPKPGIITLDEFSLYPNPTASELNFDFGYLLDEAAQVKIYNPIGQLVKEITIPAWEQTYTFDTSPLSTGVYIVKVFLGEAVETKKVVIQ